MITLSKLAKLANVSVSTASKAFSMSDEVNEQTRELIFSVAKEHGCFKKFFKAKYPKCVAAIICPEFNSLYYTRALSFLGEYLSRKNWEICVATTDFSPETEKSLIEYYYKYSNVDGIIVLSSASCAPCPDDIPTVFINSKSRPVQCSLIREDYSSAMRESLSYLKSREVTDIGFIGEALTRGKLELFKSSMAQAGLSVNPDFIRISDARFEKGGYSAMRELLSVNKPPRAVICAYDYMAIGAMKCASDMGLDIPRDIAVMGMDNVPEAEYLTPALSSLSSPIEELCRLAADELICRLDSASPPREHTVDAEFFLRESFIIE